MSGFSNGMFTLYGLRGWKNADMARDVRDKDTSVSMRSLIRAQFPGLLASAIARNSRSRAVIRTPKIGGRTVPVVYTGSLICRKVIHPKTSISLKDSSGFSSMKIP